MGLSRLLILMLLLGATGVHAQNYLCDSVCLYRRGDYGSTNWRIPAILSLDDGTLLAVNDKRKYNHRDLPEDIDIVCRRSTDLGRTWSEQQTLIEGRGRGRGYGDPALVQATNGDVLCLFAGHNGYFQSTDSVPICVFLKRSTDRGQNWGDTVNLTAVMWDDSSSYRAAFVASGNGLRLTIGPHAGRLLFVAAMLRRAEWVSDNYVIYSDDDGLSWHRSDIAYRGGDEAKLIELADGRVLISVRRHGARGWNTSADGGHTWGSQGTWPEMTVNACNGDMLRIDDTVLVHSIPNSLLREDVSLFFSTDEGRTWHTPTLLVAGASVYSSLTRLADGTVGCFVEKGPDTACDLWFYRIDINKILPIVKKVVSLHRNFVGSE